jgi:hypothetical protein
MRYNRFRTIRSLHDEFRTIGPLHFTKYTRNAEFDRSTTNSEQLDRCTSQSTRGPTNSEQAFQTIVDEVVEELIWVVTDNLTFDTGGWSEFFNGHFSFTEQ